MLEKLFKLKENKTTVRTEIIAGLTTFMTMAYIIALNPNLLTGFGAEGMELWNGVFMATCVASAIGMFVMAIAANKPFAMAPGMGLNSFFAVVVANIVSITGMTYLQSFQAALCIILVEGIVFILLSVLNIREQIVDAIPLGVRLGIAPAIGMMLMNIGIGSNAGVYSETGGPFYVMRDFFGALTAGLAKDNMGSGYSTMVLTVVTMFVGLFVIVLLAKMAVKGAVLIGEDDWAAIGETLYLTGIPGMTETLTGARQLILPIACRRANSTGRPHVSCHATRVYSVFPAFFPASGTKPSLKALGMTSVPPDCFTDS